MVNYLDEVNSNERTQVSSFSERNRSSFQSILSFYSTLACLAVILASHPPDDNVAVGCRRNLEASSARAVPTVRALSLPLHPSSSLSILRILRHCSSSSMSLPHPIAEETAATDDCICSHPQKSAPIPSTRIPKTTAMAPPTTTPITRSVYLLPLTDEGAPDVPGSYIYLPAPSEPAYSIRFNIPGTSSICRQGTLWVNIPGKNEEFHRDNYKAYPLSALPRTWCTFSR